VLFCSCQIAKRRVADAPTADPEGTAWVHNSAPTDIVRMSVLSGTHKAFGGSVLSRFETM